MVGWGWCCSVAQIAQNHFQHAFNILEHSIVPESQHDKPGTFEELCSFFIVCRCVEILAAVQLNDDFAFQADKIKNEVAEWMLAAKFAAVELAVAQALPQPGLCIGGRIAQSALQVRAKDFLVGLSSHDCIPFAREFFNTIPTQPSP